MRTRSRTRSRSSRSTPPRTSTDSPLLLAGDFSKPVYRHLAERAWRKDGDLAILVRLAPSPPRPARLRACADLPPHPTDAACHPDARHPRPPRRDQALGRRAAHGRRLDHRAGLVHQARRRASFRARSPSFVQVLTLHTLRADSARIRRLGAGLPPGGASVHAARRRPWCVLPFLASSRASSSVPSNVSLTRVSFVQTCPTSSTRLSPPSPTSSCALSSLAQASLSRFPADAD